MQALYNATKGWNNIPDMDLSGNKKYIDEGNNYGELSTTESGIYITKKNVKVENIRDNQNPTIPYDQSKKLKARLPKLSELYLSDNSLCTLHTNLCSAWLLEYLGIYSSSTYLPNIMGYWLLSSCKDKSNMAYSIAMTGGINTGGVSNNGLYGIRPVITIPISYLYN